MKKRIIFFMLVISIFVLMVSIGYSENKKDKLAEEMSQDMKTLEKVEQKSVLSKIDLLCFKYDVDPKILRDDLFEYFNTDWLTSHQDTNNIKTSDEDINNVIDEIMSEELIDIDKLLSMSKKHNVPISKISGIVYDYTIWEKLKQIKQYQETIAAE